MLISSSNINGADTSSSAVPAELLLHDPPRFSEDIDSNCSTPFVSAPSSPAHEPSGYFFSAPASPMHFLLLTESTKTLSSEYEPVYRSSDSGTFEFEFSSRFSPNGSMTSADELFFNGQIRPMRLSSHLQRPQGIAAFVDLDTEDVDKCASGRGRVLTMRSNKQAHRKARSMSPLRTAQYQWLEFKTVAANLDHKIHMKENECEAVPQSNGITPSCSASSSRSSSSGRNSKKWTFLKEFLQRSKSEGRANHREKYLWSVIPLSSATNRKNSPSPALSPSSSLEKNKGKHEKETQKQKKGKNEPVARKPAKGVWKRKVRPSAHELHYTANRAQAEEMKKKTYLPYRQGLLGCLGFSSKSYGAFSGFTRNLNPISSR